MKFPVAALLLLLGLAPAACVIEDDVFYRMLCDPVAGELSPATGSPNGQYEVEITGRFVSSSYEGFAEYDVVVRVGSQDAEVTQVEREGCGACDACLTDADFCIDCRDVCDGLEPYGEVTETCSERVVVRVPPGEPGEEVVTLINGHGATADLSFTYVGYCEDGEDNDGDGLADSEDPGCEATDGSVETGPCEDLADNDGDSWIDAQDPGCAVGPQGTDEELTWDSECNNGVDDDGDGFTDGADPDCEDGYDEAEAVE
jgi:hypothetical protein